MTKRVVVTLDLDFDERMDCNETGAYCRGLLDAIFAGRGDIEVLDVDVEEMSDSEESEPERDYDLDEVVCDCSRCKRK